MRRFGIRELYKEAKLDIPYAQYSKLNKLFFQFIIKKLLEGHKVYLPSGMGSIQVVGKKQEYRVVDGKIRGLSPNWKGTMEYRKKNPGSTKVLYFDNSNSDNIRYKIRWSKFRIHAKHKKFYTLRFTRTVKRTLSAMIKEDNSKYFVL